MSGEEIFDGIYGNLVHLIVEVSVIRAGNDNHLFVIWGASSGRGSTTPPPDYLRSKEPVLARRQFRTFADVLRYSLNAIFTWITINSQ